MSKKKSLLSGFLNEIVEQQSTIEKEKEITILEELKIFIRSLTKEEYEQLEANLIAEGCRDALIVWNNGKQLILVDGHNRYDICSKHNISYKTVEKEFENLEQVKDWMIANQLGKRNLSEEEKKYLRGLQYKREKKKVGENQHSLGVDNLSTPKKTVEKLAEMHKVSAKTIQRDEKFALGIDKIANNNSEIKQKILNKNIKVPQELIQKIADNDYNKKTLESLRNAILKEDTGKVKEISQNLLNVQSESVADEASSIRKEIMEKLKTITDVKVLQKIAKILN